MVGGGLVGCETALWLAQNGKQVTILEAMDKILGLNGPLCSANKEMLELLVPYNGVEVVIHVGLETVALNGKCFQIHVKEGDKVKAGDLLADADLEFIKETGRNSITPIVIGSSLEGKELVCEEGEVQAGKTVIMEIKQK